MTDKERFDKHCVESWYRTQLSRLEDIVYDYEIGRTDTDQVFHLMGIEKGYLLRKFQDKYISQEQYSMYQEEWNDAMKYVMELVEIKKEDPMCNPNG